MVINAFLKFFLVQLLPTGLDRKINRLHESCLSIIYNDKQSSFEMLLEKDSCVSIHNRNVQSLVTEM